MNGLISGLHYRARQRDPFTHPLKKKKEEGAGGGGTREKLKKKIILAVRRCQKDRQGAERQAYTHTRTPPGARKINARIDNSEIQGGKKGGKKNARKTEKTPGDTDIRVHSRLVYWAEPAGGGI